MSTLPPFNHVPKEAAYAFISDILRLPGEETTALQELIAYEDGHFRAVFSAEYFQGKDAPSKSQWNTLKKKLKRHDKRVFVLKEVGSTRTRDGTSCLYLEFGFLKNE